MASILSRMQLSQSELLENENPQKSVNVVVSLSLLGFKGYGIVESFSFSRSSFLQAVFVDTLKLRTTDSDCTRRVIPETSVGHRQLVLSPRQRWRPLPSVRVRPDRRPDTPWGHSRSSYLASSVDPSVDLAPAHPSACAVGPPREIGQSASWHWRRKREGALEKHEKSRERR